MLIGSLCSGVLGLELGLLDALGGGEVAWHAEIDPAACKVLELRFPGVPNLGDIARVLWEQIRRVHVLCVGFPCQDVSHAGLRKGLRPGTRSGVWAHVAYAISVLRPPLVLIENVGGLLSARGVRPVDGHDVGELSGDDLRALGVVLGDLAEIGYDATWVGVRASDAGAPHGRLRIFILARDAAADADADEPERERVGRDVGNPPDRGARVVADGHDDERRRAGDAEQAGMGDRAAADAADDGRERRRPARGRRTGPADRGVAAANADRRGRGAGEPDVRAGEPDADRRAPADTDCGRREDDSERDLGSALGPDDSALGDDADRRRDAARDATGERRGGHPEHDREPDAPRTWGQYEPAIRRWESVVGRAAPAPTEPGELNQGRLRRCCDELGIDGWAARELIVRGWWGQRLNPRFSEWMMGLPAGWVTDLIGPGGISRNDAMRLIGNGVVPAQASLAVRILHDLERSA